jgi:hypothetical protein
MVGSMSSSTWVTLAPYKPGDMLTRQNAGVDLLKGFALEDSDMTKFRQVMDVNVMSAVLVRGGLNCSGARASVLMPVYERGHQGHEGAVAAGRQDYQQRLNISQFSPSQ